MPKEEQYGSVFFRNLQSGLRVWEYDRATNQINYKICPQAIECGSQATFLCEPHYKSKKHWKNARGSNHKAQTFLTNKPSTSHSSPILF